MSIKNGNSPLLNDRHLEDLRSSGLSDETIKASRCYSASGTEVHHITGMDVGPGLVIPYGGIPTAPATRISTGSARIGRNDACPCGSGKKAKECCWDTPQGPPLARVKPDNPPLFNGKPAKYLTPKKAGNHPYFPPTLDAQVLDDPSRMLLITEGEKKALKSVQEGFDCVALPGVWGFVQKKDGKSVPIPELDRIKWEGRSVFIVYDSDLADNESVQWAEWRLAELLVQRGADVKVVRIPGNDDEKKMGLDDFLSAYGKKAFQKLMDQATVPAPPNGYIPISGPYCIEKGRMGYTRVEGRGGSAVKVFVPLSNFDAKIVAERAIDNGVEVSRGFVLEGRLANGCQLPSIEVTAAQFNSMGWVTQHWGVQACIAAGVSAKDRLREGIQLNSADAEIRHTFAHTGWRKIKGRWRYLHAGLSDIQVALDPPLDQYALPESPDDIPGAFRHSLSLLDIAPDEIAIPLLGAVYLAPVCELLHPDFAVFLVGKTGSLKSTLLALFLSHYGSFGRTNLPGSWESTDNALELRLFALKDVLCPIDDYAPQADSYGQRKLEQRLHRIIRGVGNISGRSRLNADLSARSKYPPRGLLVSTGEDLPSGQSILARLLSVEVEREKLNMELITEAQQKADRLPHAMAGYIDWLTPQMDRLPEYLSAQWRENRTRFTSNGGHLRIPEILAYLTLGMDLFAACALDIGALSETGVRELSDRTYTALIRLGEAHARRVIEEDPADIFLSTLSAMLAQGTAILSHRDIATDLSNIVGWNDEEYAYLIPKAAHNAIGHYLRQGGGHFPYSPQALYKALDARGILVRGKDGKSTRQIKIRGKNQRVLQIPLQSLEADREEGNEVTLTVASG